MAENSSERYPYHILIDLAGIPIWLHLQYAEAYRYFGSFCFDASGPKENQSNNVSCKGISLPEDDWAILNKHGFSRCGQVEASYLASYCSDILLHHNMCIIHAVAFRNSNKAWIIAAESGVGKSTQVHTLQELFPGEFSVICGDRAILQILDDGTAMVHPSPWNGKEFWGGADAAPLAGILLLRRGTENSITRLDKKSAALRFYKSLIHSASNEEIVRLSALFADKLLQRVPVWDFENNDIPDSTRLLYQKVLLEESE